MLCPPPFGSALLSPRVPQAQSCLARVTDQRGG